MKNNRKQLRNEMEQIAMILRIKNIEYLDDFLLTKAINATSNGDIEYEVEPDYDIYPERISIALDEIEFLHETERRENNAKGSIKRPN